MFFKRLSRSRSNSQSYVDDYRHDSKANSAYDEKFAHPDAADLPPSSRSLDQDRPLSKDGPGGAPNMYARQQAPQEVQYGTPPMSRGGPNGYGGGGHGAFDSAPPPAQKSEPLPDLLSQAFNQALRPYNEKVDNLESEIADLRAYIDQLEGQRSEIHAWIDKRGLRPDVPATIAQQMDVSSHSTSPTHAAATLNAQLDRKITIVNFDLHRLQDDLNDSLPTPSFSACMLKFLPDITRLSSLPSGPRYAFDLLLKLGGNLNSHGGLENGDEEDLTERRAFYARLDDAMVNVVRGRFAEEGDAWGVAREIKRIEKTGAYLRNWGVEPYFPRTLDAMREGGGAMGGGGGAPAAAAGAASPGAYN